MPPIVTDVSSADRERWLETRRKYVTASDAPALLGLDPYRSALDVFLEKRGVAVPRELTEAMEAGIELEEPVLAWYGRRVGRAVEPNKLIHVSSDLDWLACTPDGFLDGTPVQVKCSGRTHAWDEQIPDHVYAQMQAEMLCLGAERSVALALVSTYGGFSLKAYDVGRDEDVCKRIIAAGRDLRLRLIDGDPPPPDGSAAAGEAIRTLYPKEVESTTVPLDIEAADVTSRIVALDEQLKVLGKERDTLRQRIQMMLGTAESGVLPGGGAWTWKTTRRSSYTVPESSSRVLRFSKKGGRQ